MVRTKKWHTRHSHPQSYSRHVLISLVVAVSSHTYRYLELREILIRTLYGCLLCSTKNRSFAVDGHSQKVEAYLSVRERILRSELKSSLVAIFLQGNKSTSKTAFWCCSPFIIWNSAKILKYTTFILLNYDWFDLTPRSFLLVNYTPIISFLPTFVHVPANKRCFLAENYTLQIQ